MARSAGSVLFTWSKNKSAIMNTDMEREIWQSLERLSVRKVSKCAHLKYTLAKRCTLYCVHFKFFLWTPEISSKNAVLSTIGSICQMVKVRRPMELQLSFQIEKQNHHI